MPSKRYPEHFYDDLRLEIAINQIKHDFRKLFPSVDVSQWEKIDKDISEWPKGEKFEIGEISSFWNFFNGFSRGLKLKSLISWITAENIIWRKTDVNIKDTFVTWDFPGFEFAGRWPFNLGNASEILRDPKLKEKKRILMEDSEQRARKYTPRDRFPIIVFHDKLGKIFSAGHGFYIFEGNRRAVKRMLRGEKTISAYVGSFMSDSDEWPKNYWIPTGLLRDLVFLSNKYQMEKDERAFNIVKDFYQLLLRDFTVVRTATLDEAFKGLEKNDDLLKSLLYEDLK